MTSELDLREVAAKLWLRRYFVASVTALAVVLSVAYALLATEWYRADTVLVPAESNQSLRLNAGGVSLAALAGISLDSGGTARPLAVLQSREFIRSFLQEEGLVEQIVDVAGIQPRAAPPSVLGDDALGWREAIAFFRTRVMSVSEDARKGTITLSISWIDPIVAAAWANKLVRRLNDRMRDLAATEAEMNVKFLNQELESTSVVALQQTIGRLLEVELQKLMMAKGTQEYAFHVVDPAQVPFERSFPKRTMLAALGLALGFFLSVVLVLLVDAFRRPIT